MDEDEDQLRKCEIPDIALHRWYIVAVIGTLLSLVSLISNILIARVLLQRKHSNFFFLGVLAVSDVFLSFCYFPVVAMDVVRYSVPLWLVKMWWHYIGPMLAGCHVAMTFSCFMIILGSIERYLITVKSQYLCCFRSSRSRFTIIMLCIALLLRGTAVFEVQIVKNGDCDGVLEYEPALTKLGESWLYGTIFKFYLRTITTVFIPFGLLSFLNYRIVTILRRQLRSAAMFRFGSSEHKLKARSATRLLVLIVFSYLLANTLNVFITSWEFIDFDSINDYYTIYELMTDLISVLYILTCATRLLIYISCNEEIRFALNDYLFSARSKSMSSLRDFKPIQKLHYEGSIRQKSVAVGTDFDKIALAVVLSQRARDLHHSFAVPTNNGSISGEHQLTEDKLNSDYDETKSLIIANPLISVSATSTPTMERKNSPSSSSSNYNLVVKVVPYT